MEKSSVDEKKLAELQAKLDSSKPVAIGCEMRLEAFDWLMENLNIIDRRTYSVDHNIVIVGKDKLHGKFQGKLIMSDGSSKFISLREKI